MVGFLRRDDRDICGYKKVDVQDKHYWNCNSPSQRCLSYNAFRKPSTYDSFFYGDPTLTISSSNETDAILVLIAKPLLRE
ncbi:hypothetical protein STEG23_036899 [Scotinomys teguina]